ncbi:Hypothetical predicted protein [Mytilus galloprovincialis]|uniref:TIR domain-containing protein n=1 Tax=Mytilus galloprovincialis TaxID=29158 RepID=A0A8B6BSC8_MYTGA|nr:Hypothetical predicted protein [Mytilus galloprovincialis]
MANPLFLKSKEETLEYDAYVAYCDGDYEWVYGPLRIFLEERRNYKLLLLDRGNVLAGEHRLFALNNSILKCKKIILVISKEFVNNDWAYYEATVGIEHFLGLHNCYKSGKDNQNRNTAMCFSNDVIGRQRSHS